MQHCSRRFLSASRNSLRIVCILAGILFIYIWKHDVISDVFRLLAGSAAVCFIVHPLSAFYERKLIRPIAVLLAMLTYASILFSGVWFLLPRLISEIAGLIAVLPESVERIFAWLQTIESLFSARFPGFSVQLSAIAADSLPTIAMETVSFAGNTADFLCRFALMITLGYFFLCDRERLFLLLELLIPRSMRQTAVRMGIAVSTELKCYLRGQGLISATVGALSAIGLAAAGIPSSLALGLLVGILNMIPYFGPIIGCIPAVLAAIPEGAGAVLSAIAVLWIVQQIDSMLISPRIMSGIAGISPAAVLLSVFIGSGFGGIVGMLLALPSVMAFRTVFRVFVQRHKNV